MPIDDPAQLLLQYFCLLFSLCVHEAAHAAMANWCGDPSARLLGRMTLDPRKHIDVMGTVVLPLLMMTTGIPYLFGWAKPVPFNRRNLHNVRRDPVLIALAGPLSNVAIALTCAILFRIYFMLALNGVIMPEAVAELLEGMIGINILLALFNMIPLPPLDGHHVLYYFLGSRGKEMVERIGPFGIIIAVVFVSGPWLRATMPIADRVITFIITYGLDLQ